jgi:hypothetical protein
LAPALEVPHDNIQVFVYVDDNQNGKPDSGETRVPGVAVTLNVNGSDVLTRQTDDSGRAWFGPGWGTGADIVLKMLPTADTGDGYPYHHFS